MVTGIREYVEGFDYEEQERGISVTQVFIYDPADIVSNVTLPSMGDIFVPNNFILDSPIYNELSMKLGTENSGLRCRRRGWQPIEGDRTKIRWVCNYTNEVSDPVIFIPLSSNNATPSDPTLLPINFEYSGEYITSNQKTSGTKPWYWQSGGVTDPVEQAIPHKICSATARVLRYVPDVGSSENYGYARFTTVTKQLRGRVNQYADTPSILQGGAGCWMFAGCSTKPFRSFDDDLWWEAELTFTYRDPDGSDDEGWNKLLRADKTTKNGEWDLPVNQNPKYTGDDKSYLYGDFSALFDESQDPLPD